jgi:hypothetical protein
VLPLIVRTASDVQVLRDNARAVRRLPRRGVQVAVNRLSADEARNFQASIAAYVRACGCAEGGATAFVAAIAVATSLAWRMYVRGPRWSDVGAAVEGVCLAVLLAGLAKVFGLLAARRRFERSCDEVIRMINSR